MGSGKTVAVAVCSWVIAGVEQKMGSGKTVAVAVAVAVCSWVIAGVEQKGEWAVGKIVAVAMATAAGGISGWGDGNGSVPDCFIIQTNYYFCKIYNYYRLYILIMSKETISYSAEGLSCPVDLVKLDEHRVRLVAFFVLLLVVVFILTGNPLVVAFLLTDFLLRTLNLTNYSPLAWLGGVVVKQTGLKPKPVDRAPKRFAAFVGLAFLAAILTAALTGFVITARVIAGILVVFGALESLLGFCAGCYVYTLIGRFR